MRRSGLALLACAGCGPVHVVLAAPPAPPGVPHTAEIAELAVSDRGDAALSADDLGSVRVWPTLDGTREPVVLASARPRALAIDRAGDHLVAAVLDDAGTVTVSVLAASGAVLRRAQLGGDVAVEQVLVLGDRVVVRRADQSLERCDPSAHCARLSVDPSQRIAAIAARNGEAIALVTSRTAADVRRIELEGALRWGASVAVSEAAVTDVLALSPDHQSFAVGLPDHRVAVYDRSTGRIAAAGPTPEAERAVGFLDREQLVTVRAEMLVLGEVGAGVDLWVANPTPVVSNPAAVALGGDLIVTGTAAGGLALSGPGGVRYLGWHDVGGGNLQVLRDGLVVEVTATEHVWLDGALAATRTASFDKLRDFRDGVAIGPHQVAYFAFPGGHAAIELVDLDHPESPHELGTEPVVGRLVWDAGLGQLAVDGEPSAIDRFAIDVDRLTATRLAPLERTLPPDAPPPRLLDPARAGGYVAVALALVDGRELIARYREAPGTLAPIAPAVTDVPRGEVRAFDARGAAWQLTADPGLALTATIGPRVIGHVPLALATDLAIGDDGRVAAATPNTVVLYDAAGRELWRRGWWTTTSLRFDRRGRLIVLAGSALLAVDPASGQVIARACGWGFGLGGEPPVQNELDEPSLCEDSPR